MGYDFKENLKEILRAILIGLLTGPFCLWLLFKWLFKVFLVFLGLYLFVWLCALIATIAGYLHL